MHTVYENIYAIIRKIPKGRVATYGQVAHLAKNSGGARQVGYALHALSSNSGVPWHRVINSRGEVSPRKAPGRDSLQRQILEKEGVLFNPRGRVTLDDFLWQPRRRKSAKP